jgi:DNA-binding transcriptional MocR family regulator
MRALERVEETRALRRAQLRHQYEHAVASLARALPDVDVPPVDGGLSLWLRLPRGTGSGLADVAARFGVAIVPGSVLSHRGAADEGVRVVYARDPATFDAGASRLAAAWAAYRAQSGAGQRTAIGSFVV